MKVENSDVVIIGSGVAGLICALSLDKNFKIILITKKKLKDSNSYLAQGGISACRGKEDREEYIEDTLIAGHYKNNREAVEILVDNHLEKINQKIKEVVKMESSNTENLEFTIIVTINSGSDLGFTQFKNIVKTVSTAHSEENIVFHNYIIEEKFENTVETIIYLKKR